MNNARNHILSRLRKSPSFDLKPAEQDKLNCLNWNTDKKVNRFTELMKAAHAEIHDATQDNWLTELQYICRAKHLNNLLFSSNTKWGETILRQADRFPVLKNYSQPIAEWKLEMFDGIDAAFTSTYGGIAETGTLILWPDAHEPRLMSLVPPVHIALLEKSKVYSTFAEAVEVQDWIKTELPANILLVSGPSKSADIEQTLTYGIHGPKELVVILL
ncbi:MAG TPA: lactate utilization protein [Nitrosomonas sp.]|nr:lactate utilization protein [Nitrosomonas sp.]